jgi:PTS system nitrogen regulatory IIA component
VHITDFVPAHAVIVELHASGAAAAIDELSAELARVSGVEFGRVRALLLERERLGSTAIGNAVAVPHARTDVTRTVGVLGISKRGIDFGASGGELVHIFIAFLSPHQAGSDLMALVAVAQVFIDPEVRKTIVAAQTSEEAYRLLSACS